MRLQKSFFAFLNEIKKSIDERQITDNLHGTFVMFVYALYKNILYYFILWITMTHKFSVTYLPLPKINFT